MNITVTVSNCTNNSACFVWHGSLAMQLQIGEIGLHVLACLVLIWFGMAIKRRVPLEHPIYAVLHLVNM